jgi:hypothetical protein
MLPEHDLQLGSLLFLCFQHATKSGHYNRVLLRWYWSSSVCLLRLDRVGLTFVTVPLRRSLELAKRGGWKVYATGRDLTKMKELEGVPNIVTRTLDVTKDEQVVAIVAEIAEVEGRIDCIINNAGSLCIGMCDPLLSTQSHSRWGVSRSNRGHTSLNCAGGL